MAAPASLSSVITTAVTDLVAAGVTVYVSGQITAAELSTLPDEYVVLHPFDALDYTNDGASHGEVVMQVDAWALSPGAALALLDTADAALTGWQRNTTRSLGRDGRHTGSMADFNRLR